MARRRLVLLALLFVAVMTALAAWQMGWLERTPAPPPHPLAGIAADDIATIAVLTPDGAQPVTGPALAKTAAAIASLKTMPRLDGRSVTWGSAAMLRAVTDDGVALSLQVKPLEGGAAVRVTADGSRGEAASEAAAIRTLRLNAYKVGPELAAALLQRPSAPAPTSPASTRPVPATLSPTR
ncbi:MAG: hypothetical protein Q7J32_12365 [Sphingomonadaceae bacterium]|nr:hypothetical protein [Sphingomonadaceae bacterium]